MHKGTVSGNGKRATIMSPSINMTTKIEMIFKLNLQCLNNLSRRREGRYLFASKLTMETCLGIERGKLYLSTFLLKI